MEEFFEKAIVFLCAAAVFALILAFYAILATLPIWYAWNHVLTDLFAVKACTLGQAFWLAVFMAGFGPRSAVTK